MTGAAARIPPFTRALGVGGLVPFVVFSGALWLPLDPNQRALATALLLSYAALILSFLGAIHWGLALRGVAPDAEPDPLALLWGVCPCLIAWLAMMLPVVADTAVLCAGFFAQWLMDRFRLGALGAPPWLFRLRSRLSLGVLICLLSAGLALR